MVGSTQSCLGLACVRDTRAPVVLLVLPALLALPSVASPSSEDSEKSDIGRMIAAAEICCCPRRGPSAFLRKGAAATGQNAAVAEWMTTLNASGLWPDIDYSNCTHEADYGCGDNWRAAEHIYVRVLSMAQVFRSPVR